MAIPGEISTREVHPIEPGRPLTQAERYLLDTSSEIAFTRRRREIAMSEADAARAELVGCEYRAMALALEARRARMPRVLSARALHGDMRQIADGMPGPIGAGEVAPARPMREEMAAPPAPAPPTALARLWGWVTGTPPTPPASPVLASYADGELPPGQRGREDVTQYSLATWGLVPRKTSSSPGEALGKRAGLAQGLLKAVK